MKINIFSCFLESYEDEWSYFKNSRNTKYETLLASKLPSSFWERSWRKRISEVNL